MRRMVGLVVTAERERHEGEAAAVLQEPAAPHQPGRILFSSESSPIKTLSVSRRRLFHLLQRQLTLQLAANSRGGDIDPRRRPPHAATPEGILARWLTADPRRLTGGFLKLRLHGCRSKPVSGDSGGLGDPAVVTNGKPARKGFLPTAGTEPPVAASPTAYQRVSEAPSSVSAAAATSQRGGSGSSLQGGSSASWLWGKAAPDAAYRSCRTAAKEGERAAERSGKVLAGGFLAGLIECIVCLAPYRPTGGGLLCTPCLLRLGSSTQTIAGPCSTVLRAKHKLSPAPQRPQKGEEDVSREERPALVGDSEVRTFPDGMPKRRRFKRSSSPVAVLQQQQKRGEQHQQKSTDSAGNGGRRKDDAGWRARATAVAAATAESSSWWSSSDATGEAPVVPPMLLPLLPSIFSLHARPWPPPPAKRRRLVSRRRRGLACLAAASRVETPWGLPQTTLSESPQPEGEGRSQETDTGAVASDAAPQPAAEGAGVTETHVDVRAGGTKAEGETASEPTAAGETEPKQQAAATGGNVGATCKLGDSATCLSPYCPTSLPLGNPGEGPARSAKEGKSFTCCCPTASPLAYADEALPRRRRGRMSEPAKASHAAATAAAVLSSGADVREIAAAAAAVATLKTEQRHEQQTPPSRLRRRSWGPDAGLSAAAAAAPTAASEGTPACRSSSSTTAAAEECSTEPAAAIPARAAPTASRTVPSDAAEPEGSGSTSPSSSSPHKVSDSGTPMGGAPSPPPRHAGLARISQGLIVGPSSLGRGSGLGIYSCKDFSRRALVCEYSGVLIDRGTALLLRRMRCASHVINVQMQHLYLLGFHTPCPLLGGGAFVNDGRWRTGGEEGPGVSVRFRVMFDRYRAAQRVMIVAMKDIKRGEELLTSYDNDYWRLMAQSTQKKQR